MARSRTMTVVFTDLVGSTQTLVELGPNRSQSFRREHDRLVSGCIRSTGGVFEKNTGDGFMAVFESAQDALRFSSQVQSAARTIDLRWRDIDVGIRVGISTGDVQPDQGDWFGPAVNEAARLCALASGGQVLASVTTAVLTGRSQDHDFKDLGEKELKGLGSVGVVEVSNATGQGSRFDLPAGVTKSLDQIMAGRERELEVAGELAAEVQMLARRTLVLSGEPGIGKTRLAAEIAFNLSFDGWRVLHGRCFKQQLAPFEPLVEAFTPLVASMEDNELAEHIDTYGPEIERFLPRGNENADRYWDDGVGQDLALHRLFRSASGLLSRAAAESPVLLVLEDIHWGDADTLRLLEHLVQQAEPEPILILATVRDSDVEDGSVVQRLLLGIRRDAAGKVVDLEPLGESSVRAMVDALVSGSRDHRNELVDVVLHNSAGNPLFARHLAEHLGEVDPADLADHIGSQARPGGRSLPGEIRALVHSRLAEVSTEARSMLDSAAVCGESFSLELLGAVCGLDFDQLVDLVDPMIRSGFLSENPELPDRLEFAHPLVQGSLWSDLGAARKAQLHRRVAEALLLESPTEDAEVISLARHGLGGLAAGLEPNSVVQWTVAAASRLLDRLAAEEALALLTEAMQRTARKDLDARARFDLHRVELRAHEQRLETVSTRDAFVAALRIAVDHRQPEWTAELKPVAALGQQNTDDDEFFELLEQALEMVGEGVSEARGRLLGLLGWRLIIAGRVEEAKGLSEMAADCAEQLGDVVARSGTLLVRGLANLGPGTLEQAESSLRSAFELAGSAVPTWEASHYRMSADRFLGIAALLRGDRSHFDARISNMLDEADRTGSLLAQAHSRQLSAMLALLDGDLAEAESRAGRLLEVAADEPSYQLAYAAQLQLIRREQGRSAELLPMMEAISVPTPENLPVMAVFAQMLIECGETDRAVEALGQAMELQRSGDSNHWLAPVVMCELADAAAMLGDQEAAAELLPRLEAYGGLLALPPSGVICLGAVDRHLGQLRLVLGDHAQALLLLDAAAELEKRVGAPACRARTLAWLQRVKGAPADSARRECRELSEYLGLAGVLAMLRETATAQ